MSNAKSYTLAGKESDFCENQISFMTINSAKLPICASQILISTAYKLKIPCFIKRIQKQLEQLENNNL